MSVAFFVRHGKASAFSSSADYDELSAPGVEQSEALGAWLADEGPRFDAVFTGPRRRHQQTCARVGQVLEARGLPLPTPVVLPELDEHDGIGLVFKALPALAAQDPELQRIALSIAARGQLSPDDALAAFKRITRRWVRGEIGHAEVEPWPAFRARVGRAMARIAALGRGKTAIAFTSAGTIAAATAASLDVRDDEKVLDLSWSLYNASVTEIDFADDRWALRSFNGTPHLRDKRLISSV